MNELVTVVKTKYNACNHMTMKGPKGHIWECNLVAVWDQMVDIYV